MGLGSTDLISRAKAREMALELRLTLHQGRNPLAEKRAKITGSTFDEMAAAYIASNKAAWKGGGKSAGQWESSLKTYASPAIGHKQIPRITANDIAEILRPIWLEKGETGKRVRGRIELILNFAAAKGCPYEGKDNPASLKILRHLLPKRGKAVKHHKHIPIDEIPAFVADLRTRENVSARALLFTLLTAARTEETIGAVWDEFNIGAEVWTIPDERMKAGREHNVPLVPSVITLLNALPRGEWVFQGPKGRLSNMALLEQMRQLRGKGATVHGLRASFKTWAEERTDTAREVVETCLAHVVGGKAERAYRRGEMLEKRRALMLQWESFCLGTPAPRQSKLLQQLKERRVII